MAYRNVDKAKNEAVEWALAHGMAMKVTSDSARHPAFSLSPTPIQGDRYEQLSSTVHLLGRLIHAVSEDHDFLHQAIAPITEGDAFFSALLAMHQALHNGLKPALRRPLLIMRSDFMDDVELGPKLVEFNGIAAGMGPFGQRIHELHRHLKTQWPVPFEQWSGSEPGALIENRALERLADGIAAATTSIKQEFNDEGLATFLMVVQEHEDNVYDQHLLEYALQQRGLRTVRRTFRELYDGLTTGPGDRLLLEGIGPVDSVYLRSGYQYCDYAAKDLIGQACCEALMQTRIRIEQHRVAVNATVSQQLATSKRVQMLLSGFDAQALTRFDLSLSEAESVKHLLGEMAPVTALSLERVETSPPGHWVLKNQGEGGGHCVFDEAIPAKLKQLRPEDYPAWTLMRRLHPSAREKSAYVVRKGEIHRIDDLISEIGMFTIHFNGESALDNEGYAGYLIRSKSAQVTEGGVHSGMGALDSLMLTP
ncbi:glutathione synthase [Ferrimonas balearica]|uniref:glutathione synthase n=1 Tax=Ferrimonas balearica TaxID=44012 RepID=UPI001C9904AE|nr:glutathione synthase [Ferrimonas balearica]MBY5920599.1 glutathione synthase [Ferrimonas balearica]MBY5996716.1 glutathione synthase [Ferrimonas balearica]